MLSLDREPERLVLVEIGRLPDAFNDYGRFETVLRAVAGRHITYAELIGQA